MDTAIINMFKELRETMSQNVKESMRTMSHQIENINRLKLQKRHHTETLRLQSTITERGFSIEVQQQILDDRRKESGNLKIGQVQLFIVRNRKKP